MIYCLHKFFCVKQVGFVNSLAFSKSGQFLVAGVGQVKFYSFQSHPCRKTPIHLHLQLEMLYCFGFLLNLVFIKYTCIWQKILCWDSNLTNCFSQSIAVESLKPLIVVPRPTWLMCIKLSSSSQCGLQLNHLGLSYAHLTLNL